MSATIEVTKVTKQFGPVTALDGVDLILQQGEFISLIGPSGCGKTTLLRLAAGLDEPSSGVVKVNGDPPFAACKKHAIGVAFQRPALIPSRTALQNVHLTLEITGKNGCLSPEKLLRDFGLGNFLNHYPHQLSGGMQQRVNIACAMAHNPAVLLLDEPFGALDEMTRETLGDWLANVLSGTRQTVVFVTHSVAESVILSDQVVLMSPHPGKIAGIFPVDLPRPRTREMRTSKEFSRLVTEVRKCLYGFNGGEK